MQWFDGEIDDTRLCAWLITLLDVRQFMVYEIRCHRVCSYSTHFRRFLFFLPAPPS